MDKENRSKINQLLSSNPSGIVFTSSWLVEQGYSLDLQKRYKKSHWFESIGSGAMIRTDDNVEYEGALYALQNHLNSNFHPGGRTALAMLGKTHYLELGTTKVFLFALAKDQLPTWFKQYEWRLKFSVHKTNFLPADLGLVDFEIKDFKIKISGQVRAILECFYLTPKEHSFLECHELMEGLNNLRPKSVQELLEHCSSIKVKRLFLYFAEKAGHSWFSHLKLEDIDLGKGKRSLVKNGVFIPAYQITVPRELEEYDQAGI
ncbi:type IV toxin-antitoxin system AbiEi family antitoxin [Aquiflexum sp.]|uniref:type IV toxin-antitoxin system AbiEi family antitoxin n=1 Tax=Aquiflexum sp. TaxID=1872584 RepID=UPI0035930596